jgi:hypothetical protein
MVTDVTLSTHEIVDPTLTYEVVRSAFVPVRIAVVVGPAPTPRPTPSAPSASPEVAMPAVMSVVMSSMTEPSMAVAVSMPVPTSAATVTTTSDDLVTVLTALRHG